MRKIRETAEWPHIRQLLLVLLIVPAAAASPATTGQASREATQSAKDAASAMTRAIETGDWREAERNARLVLANESAGTGRYYATRYLGVAQAAQGRCDAALFTFATAAVPDAEPRSWAALYANAVYADCLERERRFADALVAYRQAVAAEWRVTRSHLARLGGRPHLPFTPDRAWLEQRISWLLGRMNAAPAGSRERWLGVWRSAYGTRLELSAFAGDATSAAITLQPPTMYGCRGEAVGTVESDLSGSSAIASVAARHVDEKVCRLTLTLSPNNAHIEIAETPDCRQLQEPRCGFADVYERVRN